MILESENKFEIDMATSADEAFSKLEIGNYAAIICDCDMPLKNGLEFLKKLREQKNDVAFIVFTGSGREVADKALSLGADHYVDKNCSPEVVYCELANAIRKIVESKNEAHSVRWK